MAEVVADISNEAWSAIESAYRNRLRPEVRDEIEAATAAFVKQATRGVMRRKQAYKRIKQIRSTLFQQHDEWAEADRRLSDTGSKFANFLVTRKYRELTKEVRLPVYGDTTAPSNRSAVRQGRARKLISSPYGLIWIQIAACAAAEEELDQLQDDSAASRRQLQAMAWNRWIVELSSIMKSHGLPSGPGVTETKDGIRESRFGSLVRALQQHALPPGNWPHSRSSVEALDRAIKRALSDAARGQK
jgi:hypothetical protein